MADIMSQSSSLRLKLHYKLGNARTINLDSPTSDIGAESVQEFYDAISDAGVFANTSGVTDTTAISAYKIEQAKTALDLT